MVYHHPQDKYDSPPKDKYHQPLPLVVNASHGGHIDTTNDDTSLDDNREGNRDSNREGIRVIMSPADHDDNDDGSSVWRDAGGLYAHIPSRLHCSTTGSIHGRRDLDQERARAMAQEIEKQRSIERAIHAPTLGDTPGNDCGLIFRLMYYHQSRLIYLKASFLVISLTASFFSIPLPSTFSPLALESPLLRPTIAFARSTYASATGGGDSSLSPPCKGEPLDPGHRLGLGLASSGSLAEGPWRDVGEGGGMEKGNMYAHIPSRLHCPTTGSVHGMYNLL